VALAARRAVAVPGATGFAPVPDGTPMPSAVLDDALVSTVVDGSSFLAAKTAALRAHATQVAVDGGFFALSNGIGQPVSAVEHYRLVRGEPAGSRDADGREIDLFAGVSPGSDRIAASAPEL
jgi:N-acetyl-1-D-myo-inositol-2-amino-2-deoxy-alpha-D-glucopyranoside deacetylase